MCTIRTLDDSPGYVDWGYGESQARVKVFITFLSSFWFVGVCGNEMEPMKKARYDEMPGPFKPQHIS